ncbi:hypothetical protein CPC16_007138 [Podila verticillata]|nr:hypothetical protein BGZ52_008325 [Haplosporangium bisporale]KAF9209901.1 hypothetical protein BGZ59_009897 [Podila verticillata]KAF9387279.1 hypothetical protein CPC16_007138 [Podila verticillata]KAI9235407.1 MAG: hypothetical protein BYD32DRAFT_421236 [Podila humilis]KFH65056.1 hypothetical protein MVEG_08537 [Podila verticillata NRRL 6337]
MKFLSAVVVAVAAVAYTAQAAPTFLSPGVYPVASNCLDSSVVTDVHITRFDLSPVKLCPGQEQTLRIAGTGGFYSKEKLVISSQRRVLGKLVGGLQEVELCPNGNCPTNGDGTFDLTLKFTILADHWATDNGFTLTYSARNVEGPLFCQFTAVTNNIAGCPTIPTVRPTRTLIPIPTLTLN